MTENLPMGETITTQIYNNTGGTLVETPITTIDGNGSVSTALSGFTGVTDVRIVSFGPGFTARVTDTSIGAADVVLDLSTLIPVSYPSTALSSANIGFLSTDTGQRVYISAATYDAANDRVTISVDGNVVNLSDAQVNDWMQKAVKRRPEYGQVVAANNGEFITSSGALGFAQAFSERILFTPGMTDNSNYNFGHLANFTAGQGPSAYNVARNLTLQGGGTTTINVSFTTSPSNFDAASIDVAIANAGLATNEGISQLGLTTNTSVLALGLATQTDVVTARNVILGSV